MTGSQNWLLNITQEGKEIIQDLEEDGNCKIPEQELMVLILEFRGKRRRLPLCPYQPPV
jgi:hypothetical protein